MAADDRPGDPSRTILARRDGRWIATSNEFEVQLLANFRFEALGKLKRVENTLREWDRENEYLTYITDQKTAPFVEEIDQGGHLKDVKEDDYGGSNTW